MTPYSPLLLRHTSSRASAGAPACRHLQDLFLLAVLASLDLATSHTILRGKQIPGSPAHFGSRLQDFPSNGA